MSKDTVLEIQLRLRAPISEGTINDIDFLLGKTFGGGYMVADGRWFVYGYVEGSGGNEHLARRFVRAVRNWGVDPEAVDPDLVDVAEIARRAEVSHETARLWARRERRTKDPAFPSPTHVLAGNQMLWPWQAVNVWLSEHDLNGSDDVELLTTRERAIIDAELQQPELLLHSRTSG